MPHYDLLVIGAGSGNLLPEDAITSLGWSVGMVEEGPWGGTCLNRGCIPSKMFIHTANVAYSTRNSADFGVDTRLHGVDWPAIRDRVFGRIDPIASSGEDYRGGLDWVEVHKGVASFTGDRQLTVDLHEGGEVEVTADRIVLAAGSRPYVPPFDGIDDVQFHTSDDVMRLDELPGRMVIVGGGYIACELAHVFDSLGVDVTIVIRGSRLLSSDDEEVSRRFTEVSDARFRIVRGAHDVKASQHDDGTITFTVTDQHQERHDLACGVLLLATGRVPNTDVLQVGMTGVDCDDEGRVIHDLQRRTSADGIWTLGDLSSHWQLKHLANREAAAVFHNVTQPDDVDDEALEVPNLAPHPSATFGHPEVGRAGATEEQLRDAGIPFRVGRRAYGGVAYGWALEDETSFAKVLVHADTDAILGVHVMGPEASNLAQLVIAAMAAGTTATALAKETIWIHPALAEVVENALLDAVDG